MGFTLNDLAEQGVCFGADKLIVESNSSDKIYYELDGIYTEELDYSNVKGVDDLDETPWYVDYEVTCIWAERDGSIHIEVNDYE